MSCHNQSWWCRFECWASLLSHPLLLVMRLYWGYMFFMAGKAKFADMERVIGLFTSLSIPMPIFNAYLVASVEMIGGLLLLVGLFSRLASIPLAVTMLVALFTAHIDGTRLIFSNPDAFLAEKPVWYLLTTLLVLSFGPGFFSLDVIRARFCPIEKAKRAEHDHGGGCCGGH